MNESLNQQLERSVRLLTLEQEIRKAQSPLALSFLMVNQSQSVLGEATAILWQKLPGNRVTIQRISALAEIDPSNTPGLIWLKKKITHLLASQDYQQVRQLPDEEQSGWQMHWQEWLGWASTSVIWCPLMTPQQATPAGLIFIRQQPWQASDVAMAERLSVMYGYAWRAVLGTGKARRSISGWFNNRRLGWLLIISLCSLLLLPVQQSVIAPATVIAKQPFMVTAPMDGIIESVLVQANEAVTSEQVVVELEKTRLQNQVEVAGQLLEVARSRYATTQQRAFTDHEQKALLTPLRLQIEQQRSELDYARQLLRRASVSAGKKGIAIFQDASELIGKPVQLGEKIMTVADPAQVELDIRVAADDAIIMQPGARVEFYLNTGPSKALSAELVHASYQAQTTAEGILAYRLVARLNPQQTLPRIGLKGSAKLIGEQVRLYHYLFRRPVSILRQWLGW